MQSTDQLLFCSPAPQASAMCSFQAQHHTEGQLVGRGSGRRGVRTQSFCRWPTLRLWASPCVYVGRSFTHKTREMVQLSDSDKVGLVFTRWGEKCTCTPTPACRKSPSQGHLWKSPHQAALQRAGGHRAFPCPGQGFHLQERAHTPPTGAVTLTALHKHTLLSGPSR